MKYIYPKLPAVKTTPFFRIGGSGLANCLFVYAKAIIASKNTKAKIISPTWFNLSIGTYLRRESDKRHYHGLFTSDGEITGIKKAYLLSMKRKTQSTELFNNLCAGILVIDGISEYFRPLIDYHTIINDYLLKHINQSLLNEVNKYNFENTVAVHVRLGDFSARRRTPMDWYITQISKRKNAERIIVFSDGTDEELKPILNCPNTERVFFGGAIQDIIAISRCSYLIGSDSSFSAWGAYLGQVPCSFYRFHIGQILKDPSNQFIEYPT